MSKYDVYYTQLKLKEGAGEDVIKKAYKKLALKYHPDKNQGNEEATQKFLEIGTAYEKIMAHLRGEESGDEVQEEEYSGKESELEALRRQLAQERKREKRRKEQDRWEEDFKIEQMRKRKQREREEREEEYRLKEEQLRRERESRQATMKKRESRMNNLRRANTTADLYSTSWTSSKSYSSYSSYTSANESYSYSASVASKWGNVDTNLTKETTVKKITSSSTSHSSPSLSSYLLRNTSSHSTNLPGAPEATPASGNSVPTDLPFQRYDASSSDLPKKYGHSTECSSSYLRTGPNTRTSISPTYTRTSISPGLERTKLLSPKSPIFGRADPSSDQETDFNRRSYCPVEDDVGSRARRSSRLQEQLDWEKRFFKEGERKRRAREEEERLGDERLRLDRQTQQLRFDKDLREKKKWEDHFKTDFPRSSDMGFSRSSSHADGANGDDGHFMKSPPPNNAFSKSYTNRYSYTTKGSPDNAMSIGSPEISVE